MKTIEEELKQSQFQSEKVKANINILYTANWIYNKASKTLKPFGLTHEQFNVLRILWYNEPNSLRQKDILERMISPYSNLTLIIKKLVEKGFVTVNKSTTDLREYDISLCEDGISLLKLVNKIISSGKTDQNPLSESEASHLNNLLDKIRN